MGLRIRTNVQSLVAQRHFKASHDAVKDHMERLASGYRINKAADDAAGMAIAETLRADIRSLGQARRNTNDAVSLVQVAEGGLGEVTNILVRLRELGIQAASDTIGLRERGYLNLEYQALKDEVDRIAVATEYNGTRLLTGQADIQPELLEDHNFSPLEIQVDKDYYPGADSLESNNPINIIQMNLANMNALTEGDGSLELGNSLNEGGTRVDTKESAQRSIDIVDKAFQKISRYRANLGAIQNRLISTDRNLGVRIENLDLAKSRILDADFAVETANLTQQNILQQAGASVLAQANQIPQIALQLLQ
ncbi:MAG: flagellin [Oligoflexales bacterium]|nr:flagellin [Oligoflexales bacterium]